MGKTVTIEKTLLDELMQEGDFESPSEGVRRAIEVFLRQKQIERFKRLAGSNLVNLPWQTAEKIDSSN